MYTLEDLASAFSGESFDEQQLELLRIVANQHVDPNGIKNYISEKALTKNAFQKRMGNIYLKFGLNKGGRGKLDELEKLIREKLEAKTKKRKILITYFSDEEADLSIKLSKILSPSPDNDFLIIRHAISTGQKWKEEVENSLPGIEFGIACFLYKNLEDPLANSAIGFLDAHLKSFRFIYFGGIYAPTHLSLFKGLKGQEIDDFIDLKSTFNGNINFDEKNWIEHQYKEFRWRDEVLKFLADSADNPVTNSRKSSEPRIIESKTSLEDVLQLLDDETFQYEHKIIKEIVKKSLPHLFSWLPEISGTLIQEMKELKVEIGNELLLQGFPIKLSNLEKPDPDKIVDKLFSVVGCIEADDFPIKVCVLRVIQEGDSLKQKGFCANEKISSLRRDTGDRKPGIGFVQIAMTTKKPVVVRYIDEQLLGSFVNHQWIYENKLLSFSSFPVIRGDEAVGTLSMYGDREYAVFDDPKHFYFVNALVCLIAKIIVKLNKMKAIKTLLLLNREQPELFISPDRFPEQTEDQEQLKKRVFLYR
jgi:hypothetical protein